jgi:hypothetical protein
MSVLADSKPVSTEVAPRIEQACTMVARRTAGIGHL